MVYSRKNVIKSGENAIASRLSGIKTTGVIFIGISATLVFAAIALLLYYLSIKEYASIIVVVFLILISVALFIPGMIMLNYPKHATYNVLLEGCYVEERYYRGKLNKRNRQSASNAVRIARSERRVVPYLSIISTFDAYELNLLLKEKEIVEYNVKPISKIKYAKPEKQKTSSYSNHNYDSYFDDDEFDDLMD